MDQTVAPMFTASTTIYRGQPVFLLAAGRARTRAGDVDLQIETLRRFAVGMGLGELDRYLSREPPLVHSALTICTNFGVSLEIDGKGILARSAGAASEAWWALVRERARVLAILAAVDPQSSTQLPDLRKILGARRGFGAWTEAACVTELAGGAMRYMFIGGAGSVTPEPTQNSVLLDSNVLVDLERVAAGRVPAGSPLALAVRNLMLQIIHLDVIPGFALLELQSGMESPKRGEQRGQQLRAAINAWFDGGGRSARNAEIVQANYAQLVGQPIADRQFSVTAESDLVRLAMYASLLKLASLWEQAQGQFRGLQRLNLYAEFAEWMGSDLGIVLSYPLQVARDRLVGPQGAQETSYTDRLLKPGSKRSLLRLRGAAWDLSHLWRVDLARSPDNVLQTDGRDCCLVTADRALAGLRERLNLLGVLDSPTGGGAVMLHSTDVDKRLNDKLARIRDIDRALTQLALERNEHWQPPDSVRVIALVYALEERLTRPTA